MLVIRLQYITRPQLKDAILDLWSKLIDNEDQQPMRLHLAQSTPLCLFPI